ncbi:hypothetical protein Glove_386g49 [Diversispora epigaea]|uniref:Protein kinase domain-containing protein n=1 Tax=Diversispora epigaea TaxID=1348612 RepID=A0A397H456_9GLOM|nr:hypothetical protein Glove_386g49 [Diversispora epigaea]
MTLISTKLDGSNELIKCTKCKKRRPFSSSHKCKRCNAMNSQIVDSGNKNIDDFINETQFSSKREFLIWVPYENFTNVEYIGKGGFSEIYKATWEQKIYKPNQYGFKTKMTEVVLKVLNDSQNVDTGFFKELKYTYQFSGGFGIYTIQCHGVTQIPETKNYAFILEYAKDGDLHYFLNKNFAIMTWKKKLEFFINMVGGIKKIHDQKIIHRDLHSGNILINKNKNSNIPIISDLGFSQPATIKPHLSRKSQIYGIIPYMAPELFKNQQYSYASDIYSLGMIMWQLTSGHRPFHDQEHGPKLILDILDGKRPEITEDTPENWANLMKRCWHPVPSQRPTILEIYKLSQKFEYYKICESRCNSEDDIKKYYPDEYDIWLEFDEAEDKRLEMVESKKPFVKNPGYEHPNSRYYSTSLNSMLESINSTVSDLFSNNHLLSNDHFDIMNINSNLENSGHNSSAENPRKHFLDELLEEKIDADDQNEFKRRRIAEYFNECFADPNEENYSIIQ